MVRPSRRLTLSELFVNFTSVTRSSAAGAKMPMPSLQECRLMFGHQFLNPPQLLGGEPHIPSQRDRLQPKFGRQVVPIHVDVGRLVRFVAVKIKPVQTGA